MPTVPYSPVPSVSPSGGSAQPYQSSGAATPETFGSTVGAGETAIGQAEGQFANVLQKHSDSLQDRVNAAQATDLYTKSVVQVGELDKNYNALEGKAKADALPKYIEDLQKIQSDAQGSASNTEVRRQFDNDFKRRAAYSTVDASKQAGTALKQYNNKAQAARLTIAQTDAAAAQNDDARFALAEKDAFSSVDALKKENDWGPEETEVAQKKAVSSLWEKRLGAMADANPFRAKELFDANKDKLEGPVRLTVEHQVNQGIIKVGTRIDADKIVNQGAGLDGKFSKNVETAYNYYIGKGYTQNEAAAIVGNFTHESGMNPNQKHDNDTGIGIGGWRLERRVALQKFAAERGTTERDFQTQLEFGDKELNDGSQSAAREAMRNARTPGEAAAGFIHFEKPLGYTSNGDLRNAHGYANRVGLAEKIAAAAGQVQVSSDVRMGEALDKAGARAKEVFPNDPGLAATYEDTLKSRISTEFAMNKKAAVENDRYVKMTVYNEALDPEKRPTKLDQLSPQAYEAYTRMDPVQQSAVRKQFDKNATADVPLTPERWAKHQEIKGLAITDPQAFLNVNPSELDITRTLQADILKQQRSMAGKLQDTTKINSALRTVGPMLADAGVTASKSDPTKAAKYNQFVGAFNAELKTFEDEKKKFPTEEEQMKIASNLLRKTTDHWFSEDEQGFQVPPDFQSEWKPKFKSRYNREPTTQEMYTLYRKSQASAQ